MSFGFARRLIFEPTVVLIGTAPKPKIFANPLPPFHGEKVRRF